MYMGNFGKLVLFNPFVSQLSFVLWSVCCLISPQSVNPVVCKDASASTWLPLGTREVDQSLCSLEYGGRVVFRAGTE